MWMHTLGFHYKHNVYVDGHNRPDVLKCREGYLVRQFEWADDAKSTPGYLKRANVYIQFPREHAKEKFQFTENVINTHAIPNTELVEFNVDEYDFNGDEFKWEEIHH